MKLLHGFWTAGLLDVFINQTGLLCPTGKTPFSPFCVPLGPQIPFGLFKLRLQHEQGRQLATFVLQPLELSLLLWVMAAFFPIHLETLLPTYIAAEPRNGTCFRHTFFVLYSTWPFGLELKGGTTSSAQPFKSGCVIQLCLGHLCPLLPELLNILGVNGNVWAICPDMAF